MNISLLKKEISAQCENKCKGKIYRGRVNAYIIKTGTYVYQEHMVYMKRLSCPGCEYCGFFDDYLDDVLGNKSYPIIKNIEDKILYKLEVVNVSKDWETGMADDWDLEFVKLVNT